MEKLAQRTTDEARLLREAQETALEETRRNRQATEEALAAVQDEIWERQAQHAAEQSAKYNVAFSSAVESLRSAVRFSEETGRKVAQKFCDLATAYYSDPIRTNTTNMRSNYLNLARREHFRRDCNLALADLQFLSQTFQTDSSHAVEAISGILALMQEDDRRCEWFGVSPTDPRIKEYSLCESFGLAIPHDRFSISGGDGTRTAKLEFGLEQVPFSLAYAIHHDRPDKFSSIDYERDGFRVALINKDITRDHNNKVNERINEEARIALERRGTRAIFNLLAAGGIAFSLFPILDGEGPIYWLFGFGFLMALLGESFFGNHERPGDTKNGTFIGRPNSKEAWICPNCNVRNKPSAEECECCKSQ